MPQFHLLWASLLITGFASTSFAQDLPEPAVAAEESTALSSTHDESASTPASRLEALKQLKHVTRQDLKVNANAAQPEEVKDPLQPLNQEIYEFNDAIDRHIARPLSVQYKEKVPDEVRGSYRNWRKNLDEPWNAVNQLLQGRPGRAVKTLGRFTLNSLTTLGLADPARRLGLDSEDESLGTTLGYWGVPSGPYLVLPILGPSTFRDGLGRLVDSQARPQKYFFEDEPGLYWSEQLFRGLDVRSQLLDVEDVLQGDRYAAMRDIYLQHKNYEIAQKKGTEAEISFIDDEFDDSMDEENADPAPADAPE